MSKIKEHFHDKIEADMRKVGWRDRLINMIDRFFTKTEHKTITKNQFKTNSDDMSRNQNSNS